MIRLYQQRKQSWDGCEKVRSSCTRTRLVQQREIYCNLNDFAWGKGGHFFSQGAPSTQDIECPRITRPERKTSSATRTATRAR